MPTTITSPTEPTVGGSSGTWGTTLNTALDTLYANDQALQATADAALPLAGGAMTGRLDAKTTTEALVDLGSVSGTVTPDLSAGNVQTMTVTGATTVAAPSNAPAGSNVSALVLRVVAGGSFTVSWASAFKFPGGVAPVLTTGTDVMGFLSFDNGATWLMLGIQKDVR